MVFALKNSPVASRTVPFLVLFAILALPLQHLSDGLSASASIFSVGKITSKTALPQHKDRVELTSVADLRQETPKIDPSLLRVDYKQNLLVWPVVAGDLTRSPPFGVSL
jgi:hypothetical protein